MNKQISTIIPKCSECIEETVSHRNIELNFMSEIREVRQQAILLAKQLVNEICQGENRSIFFCLCGIKDISPFQFILLKGAFAEVVTYGDYNGVSVSLKVGARSILSKTQEFELSNDTALKIVNSSL